MILTNPFPKQQKMVTQVPAHHLGEM
jgi:hypothetical protein